MSGQVTDAEAKWIKETSQELTSTFAQEAINSLLETRDTLLSEIHLLREKQRS